MSTTVMILLALLIVYIPIYIWTWKSPNAIRYGFQKYGPLIKINTKLGLKLMDRLGKYRRFWRFFGIASQVFAFVEMVFMVFMIVFSVIRIPSILQSHSSLGVEYVLALPGLNPIMPFWYTLLALIIAVVLHEFAHGVQTRANGMKVENTGGLYCVVPVGAFVEPDQTDVDRCSRTAKLDLFSAGISANFIIAGVAFLLFSVVMLGGMTNQYEDNAAIYGEVEGSPADIAGIPSGAIILSMNGQAVLYEDFDDPVKMSAVRGPSYLVTITYVQDGSGVATTSAAIPWGMYISKLADDSPAGKAGLSKGDTIVKMNDTEVFTSSQFTDYMKTTSKGETVTITYVDANNAVQTTTAVLDENGNKGYGYLGVYTSTSGLNFLTPSQVLDKARNPLYGVDSLTDLPQALMGYLTMPYSGFDPLPSSIQWWYGDYNAFFWSFLELLYWLFWLNILLGITNALPAVPFDGGYIFQGWVDRLLERIGVKDAEKRDKQAAEITKNVSTLFLFAFVLIIVVAII